MKSLGLAISALFLVALMNEINGFYVQPDVINFISHPQSRIAVLNSSVTFHCSFNKTQLDASLPNVSLIWFHNGDLLNDSNNISCSSISVYSTESVVTSTCLIESVQISDEGWYQCRVIDGTDDTYCRNLPCISLVTASKTAQLKVIGEEIDVSDVYLTSNVTSAVLNCLGSESTDALFDQQIVWKKNGEFINNTDLAEILPSSNLLITSSNETVVMNVIGTYECLVSLPNDSHIMISQTNVLLPQDYGDTKNKSMSLSLTFSPSNVFVNEFLLPHASPVELVCLFNGLHSPYNISWTIDNEPIGNANRSWISMNQWSSGNYCCHMSNNNGDLSSSCLSINVIQPDPPLISTVFIDESMSFIELNCSSQYPVQWLHNGYSLDHNATSLNVPLYNKSIDELYGIYQCNKLNEMVAIYRVLPFGWTNPILSLHPVTYLPAFNLSLIMNSPSFTGGLSKELISVNVTVEASDIFSSYISFYTLTELLEINNLRRNEYYYYIEVTVVNGMKERISETTTHTFTSCDLYEPVPPVLTLNCSEKNFSVHWKVSSLDPFPTQTINYLNIECYNASGQTISMRKEWSRLSRNGYASLVPSDNTTVCHFAMHGERQPFCTGPTSTGVCSHDELNIESSTVTPSLSSSYAENLVYTSLFISSSSSSFIVLSSSEQPTTTSTARPVTTSSVHTSTQITSGTPTPSTEQTPYPSTTVVNISSTRIISIVALFSIVISILTVCLICILALWRYKRYKNRHDIPFDYENDIQQIGLPEIISVSDIETASIETDYGYIDCTSDRFVNADLNEDEGTSPQLSPGVTVVFHPVTAVQRSSDDFHTSTNTNSTNSTNTNPTNNFIRPGSNNSNIELINHSNHRILNVSEGSNSTTSSSGMTNYLLANGIELISFTFKRDDDSNDFS